MVSRRKILSRSRDELHSDIYYMAENDDDDVWYSKEKLYAVRNDDNNNIKMLVTGFTMLDKQVHIRTLKLSSIVPGQGMLKGEVSPYH
jgi:hypothetical protein